MSNVILMMLDGLRPDALSSETTPNLSHFMQRGAYTLQAQSVMPSITLPCHVSIFHSVPPSRHGILDNEWHSMARPVQGVIEQLKLHDKRSGFVYNWEFLRDLSRSGNLYFSFFADTSFDLDGDDIIAETAVRCLTDHRLDFTFVYFGTIDIIGHAYGWMSDDYLKQISRVDKLVARVLDAAPENATVIIHSDHGGHERMHGTELPEDMTIPWMIAGPNIKPNYAIQRSVTLLDTAPMIAHLLNVPPSRDWEGKVVNEVFVQSD